MIADPGPDGDPFWVSMAGGFSNVASRSDLSGGAPVRSVRPSIWC